MLAGYGSLAIEILETTPFLDALIVPVGSGGLAAAMSTVIKHRKPSVLIYVSCVTIVGIELTFLYPVEILMDCLRPGEVESYIKFDLLYYPVSSTVLCRGCGIRSRIHCSPSRCI